MRPARGSSQAQPFGGETKRLMCRADGTRPAITQFGLLSCRVPHQNPLENICGTSKPIAVQPDASASQPAPIHDEWIGWRLG